MLYPNPASEFLTIRYKLNRENSISMKITDINGVLVYEQYAPLKADMQENHIDVHQMPVGVYFLQIGSRDQLISKKFIIMR